MEYPVDFVFDDGTIIETISQEQQKNNAEKLSARLKAYADAADSRNDEA